MSLPTAESAEYDFCVLCDQEMERDRAVSREIAEKLEGELGIKGFLQGRDGRGQGQGGVAVLSNIREAIKSTRDKIFIIYSHGTLNGKWLNQIVEQALDETYLSKRGRGGPGGIPIVPVCHGSLRAVPRLLGMCNVTYYEDEFFEAKLLHAMRR